MDTIEHIFVNGHFAASVWKYFSGLCGVECSNIPLHHYVMEWWGAEYKNVAHKIILHAIPIFICWNLWKNMCGNKYRGRQSNLARFKYLLIKIINLLLKIVFLHIQWSANWKKLVLLSESYVHEMKIVPVHWSKPSNTWVKLNSDGSSLQNLGVVGGGGIIRDIWGAIVCLFYPLERRIQQLG